MTLQTSYYSIELLIHISNVILFDAYFFSPTNKVVGRFVATSYRHPSGINILILIVRFRR